MDRVLLAIDDIQYSRHVEMTLRKVGFDVESINSEYNLNDSLLTFNPDYIVCRGQGARLTTLGLGKRLKDTKFNGKVVLIFPENFQPSSEDLIKLRMDLMLFEPISTLRLAVQLFSFSKTDVEIIRDKLLKFAITDNQFRNYEQQLLRSAGTTIDSEIQIISEMPLDANQDNNSIIIKQDSENSTEFAIEKTEVEATDMQVATAAQSYGDVKISEEARQRLKDEILGVQAELPLRIDTYNRIINKVDQDLSVGLKKRQTKRVSNKLHKDLLEEKKADNKSLQDEESELDQERISFTNALFKKS